MKAKAPTPPRRPAAASLGDYRARVVRGPRQSDGRWYWRVYQTDGSGGEPIVNTGWWHRQEVDRVLAGLVGGRALAVDVAGGATPTADDQQITVKDMLELFLGHTQQRTELSRHTQVCYRNFARPVARLLGGYRAFALLKSHIDAYVTARLAEPVMIKTGNGPEPTGRTAAVESVKAEISLLRKAYNWARTAGLVLDKEPLPSVQVRQKRRAPPARNEHTPSSADLDRVVVYFTERRGRHSWIVVLLVVLRETGVRIGEAEGLTWGAVSFGNRRIRVYGKVGYRLVPMTSELVTFLREVRASRPDETKDDRVVPPRSGLPSASGRAINAAAARLGITPFSAQGIRRSVVVALYRGGFDPGLAAAILGHSPKIALAHYRRASEGEKATALELALAAARASSSVTNPAQPQGEDGEDDDQ